MTFKIYSTSFKSSLLSFTSGNGFQVQQISDLKIANEERFLLMSAIQNNTISVWYTPLESINYDESIDMIPSSDSQSNKNQD